MADPREIDIALDYLTDAYGRQGANARQRSIWHDAFREADGGELFEAVQRLCRTKKYPPTIADVSEALAERQVAAQPAQAATCGRCADGLREVAVHRRDERAPDGVRITVGVVRCECPRGATVDSGPERRARVPDLRGQVAYLETDPTVLAWFVDPTAAQRRNLEHAAPQARSAAIAHVRGVVFGSDPESRHSASQRARTLAHDRMREASGEEAEWSA